MLVQRFSTLVARRAASVAKAGDAYVARAAAPVANAHRDGTSGYSSSAVTSATNMQGKKLAASAAAAAAAASIIFGSPALAYNAVSPAFMVASAREYSIQPSSRTIEVDKLPPLPYKPEALEPYIDAQTMNIHHDKHHNTYVTKIKAALDSAPDLKSKDLVELNKAVGTDAIPSKVATAVRNNGGGHWNHSFFWKIMAPADSSEADYDKSASKELQEAIRNDFGSKDEFKSKFSDAAVGVFGSGWAWVSLDSHGHLIITTTPNQDNPLMAVAKDKSIPVLGLDVWEHAYYLKHQNKRPDYIKDWFNVINWSQVSDNFSRAQKGEVPATK
jgi:Fe-Mn family superoxide dismutase